MHFVLLPGLDGTGALFGPLREAFGAFGAEAGNVVTVGYPHDRVLDYAALVELVSLPEEPFVLVAESFSGPVALAIAARRPPLLRAVVLVATFAGPPLAGSAWLRPFVGSFLFRLALPHVLIRLLLVGAAASSSLVALVAATIRGVPSFVLAHRVRSVLAADAAVAAGACEVPVLYLQASRDRLVPDRCASELRALIPRLEVRRVDGPHLLLQANPTAAVREIREFLEGLG